MGYHSYIEEEMEELIPKNKKVIKITFAIVGIFYTIMLLKLLGIF